MALLAQPETLNADALLRIDLDAPERLFARDAKDIKNLYRRLVRKWHPDVNKDEKASAVVDHLTKLKDKAESKLAAGTWQEAGFFTCRLANGEKFRVRSDAKHVFDLGTLHVNPTTATYVVKKDFKDLFQSAVNAFGAIKFADDKMKEVYFARLPTTYRTYEAEDALILTIKKDQDDILLRDLMPFLKKEDHDRHVAWIVSRMIEMARFLDHIGMTHNAFTLDNVFASPKGHTIGLFGGWWYAKPADQNMQYAPVEAMDFLFANGRNARAAAKVDLEMIKACGRELLGDRGGTSFLKTKPAPDAMLAFLREPSSGDPQKDLERWYQKVLPDSFGGRHFVNLNVAYNDVYQPGG